MDRQPSVIAYPTVFLLNADLMLTFTASLQTQGNLADQQFPRLLAELAVKDTSEQQSPVAMARRCAVETSRIFWFEFLTSATERSKMNLFFMR
jgi:hypothetical protein